MEHTDTQLEFFARCASGFESVLANELRSLGAVRVRPLKGGVAFFGQAEDAYRVCMWTRVATRIQLVLARVNAADANELYESVFALPWETEVREAATIAVRAHGENKNLRNTQFTALKVKDALCDKLREVRGARPNVDAKDPDFALDVSLHKNRATLYLNLSGTSLHRRGYRESGVQTEAPLKETLAAGMLLAAGFSANCARNVEGESPQCGTAERNYNESSAAQDRGVRCIDPLCGSGTLAIEAALIAADIAPGILRTRWGYEGWQKHDAQAWERVHSEAQQRKQEGLARLAGKCVCIAADKDPAAINIARANAARAGVEGLIDFRVSDAADLLSKQNSAKAPHFAHQGLLATNPPYGQRMLEAGQLEGVYSALCTVVQALSQAWDLAIITPDESIDFALGEVASQVLACYNGPLEAGVRMYTNRAQRTRLKLVSLAGRDVEVGIAEAGSEQFAARLRKVAKERAKWARKEGLSCWRIYDADLPDYALSIEMLVDAHDETTRYLRIAEYQAPASIDPLLADRRFQDALAIAPVVLDIAPENVFAKVRKRAKGGSQYTEARGASKVVHVREAGYTFEVDLNGYVDTGLFLDHRITRGMLSELAAEKHFLNLFAYTGTATVYAAAHAASTTTVDLSNTYLAWAKRNMEQNGFAGPQHSFVHANVMEWLEREAQRLIQGNQHSKHAQQAQHAQRAQHAPFYDLVFCDPPTFSNSKAMGGANFDVQRDHVGLLQGIQRVLAPGGSIVFSCNLRSFKLDEATLAQNGLRVQNISAQTIPHDFERTPKVHHCFILENAL